MDNENAGYAGWAIVELLGHRKIAGFVSETSMFGTTMLEINVPQVEGGDPAFVKYYASGALYGVLPCSEEYALSCVGSWGFERHPADEMRRREEEDGQADAAVHSRDADADIDSLF